MMDNKHYIRVNGSGYIIKGFSEVFEESLSTDICINQEGGRHFELLGKTNPNVVDVNNCYLYKYENGVVRLATEVELAEQKSQQPPEPLSELEKLKKELAVTQEVIDMILMNQL